MNFTDACKWLRDNEMWFIQTLIVWIFTVIITVFFFVITVGEPTGVLIPNWLFLLTIPVACVLSNYFGQKLIKNNKFRKNLQLMGNLENKKN